MATAQTVYVDLDDVLCQAARHFLVIVEREFGKKMSYEQLTDFDVGHSCGLSAEERDELYRIVHRSDELLRMEPVSEAIAALYCWEKNGFDIAIVTGRPPQSVEASIAWLAKHRVPHSSVTVVDKYLRFPADTGAISLAELAGRQFLWAVEDSLPMAQYLAGFMNVPVALIDCPWNRSDETHSQISRYRTWEELAAAMAGKIGLTRRS